MFEGKNISVKIGGRKILERVSLELKPGEIVALIGANGAGKSTLLKTFCGDVPLAAGEILLENRPLKNWPYHELARRRAVLAQHSEMNFPFTAREVALLGRTPHIRGAESKKDISIVGEALKLVEAEPLAGQNYATLSGGEKQRVQLARVLSQIWEKPPNAARYLLLDEPTASLDLAHQHLTLQSARFFAADETAVLVVLHDLNLAAQYADKIMILHGGKNYAFDTPKKVLTPEAIREVFAVEAYVAERRDPDRTSLIVPTGRFSKVRKEL
jgi:iron complex transport system ATP-binding protein